MCATTAHAVRSACLFAVFFLQYYIHPYACITSSHSIGQPQPLTLAFLLSPHSHLSFSLSLTRTARTIFCDDTFEGGRWALVRRTAGWTQWHSARDGLRGTEVYGSYGSPTSDQAFSIAWSNVQYSEMMIMSGGVALCVYWSLSHCACINLLDSSLHFLY